MRQRVTRLTTRVKVAIGRVPLARSLTGFGWRVLVVGLVLVVLSSRLDWEDLAIAGLGCVVAVVMSAVMTLRPARFDVLLEVAPIRVNIGERAGARVTVSSAARRRSLPSRMQLDLGSRRSQFHVPSLGAGRSHDELFSIPTRRRAVIPVGPVSSVRGDPLGLARAERRWTDVVELFVHPATSPLDRLGSGFLKDLEGHTTQDLSNSDVAFHTLREYVPGDDRRHIHWRTTARTGTMMVRQFVDTRRSHLAVLLGCDLSDYLDEDEFELALSLAASLAARALRDDQSVAFLAGRQSLPCDSPQQMLDACCRIAPGDGHGGLVEGASAANELSLVPSIVVFATGSAIGLADVRSAAARLVTNARTVVLRADRTGQLSYRPAGATAVINVPSLDEFAQGLWRATQV